MKRRNKLSLLLTLHAAFGFATSFAAEEAAAILDGIDFASQQKKVAKPDIMETQVLAKKTTDLSAEEKPENVFLYMAKEAFRFVRKQLFVANRAKNYYKWVLPYKFGKGPQTTELTLWNGIYSVPNVPWDLWEDYMKYRSPTYKQPLLAAVSNHVDSLFSSNPEPIFPINDQDVLKCLYYGPLALSVKRVEGKDELDLSLMQHINIFPGYYYNIRGVEIEDVKTSGGTTEKKIVYYSKNGDKIEPGDPLYELAKFNFICCAAVFVPTISHSWVHFHLPDIFAAIHYNVSAKDSHLYGMVKQDSTLYKLLAPHVRFTLALNDSVLRSDRSPEDNSNSYLGKWFAFAEPVATTADDFLFNNSRKIIEFYTENAQGDLGELSFPPKFDDNIPYVKILMRYFNKVQNFVNDLAKNDKEFTSDLDKFMNQVALYIPAVKKTGTKPLDVLATFIWQVSIVHSTDHFTQYKFFRHMPAVQEDGTVIKGGAISPTAITKEWRECSEELHKSGKAPSLEEVADRFDYIDRFRNFLDLFGQFRPSTGLNHTMDKLFNESSVYNFSEPKLNESVKAFQQELIKLENLLKGEKNDMDDRGSLLCPLSSMSQSICF